MFRLIRLIILISAAFIGGVFYERNAQGEACAEISGFWKSGLCLISEATNE